MAAGMIILPQYMPARDRQGRLVSGARLTIYQNRTTTKVTIYSDSELATPIANPVVANSSGQFPSIWVEAGSVDTPVLYTLAVSGSSGESIGNPAVFSDWQPSLDAAVLEDALDEKQDKVGGVLNSRVRAAPGIDDTARLQAELDGGYKVIILPAGTINLSQLDIPSGVEIRGQGKGRTVLKRLPTATRNAFILASGKNAFALRDFTVDGNKANCTAAATNIVVQTACYDFEIRGVDTRNAKAVGGSYGGGLVVQDTVDAAMASASTVADCEAHDNDTYGLSAYRVQNFSFFRCEAARNVNNAGINIDNFELPVPGFPKNLNVSVSECTSWGNGTGIAMFGFRSGATALGDVASQDHFQTLALRVTNNTVFENNVHGLEIQADGAVVSSNTIYRNGSALTNGGVLLNSRRTVFSGNNVYENFYYGVDAGGARDCIITGNEISLTGTYDAGSGAANQCIALNIGAAIGVQITANQFTANGGTGAAGGAYNILASRYDGGSASNWMRWFAVGLTISENTFTLTDADQVAIKFVNGAEAGFAVNDNVVICDGVNPTTVYDFSADGAGFSQRGNRIVTSSYSQALSVASATSAILPDAGEIIDVSGTATINNLKTTAAVYWADKVRWVFMSNGGSGYTSQPTVTFTGGGGSGAAGVAVLGADGIIYGVYVTNPGSGYTSEPTVGFTGGGGSGAAATSVIGCNNATDRIVTLKFQNAATVANGAGNIYLTGGSFTGSAFGLSSLTLRGAFGNWYEVARAA